MGYFTFCSHEVLAQAAQFRPHSSRARHPVTDEGQRLLLPWAMRCPPRSRAVFRLWASFLLLALLGPERGQGRECGCWAGGFQNPRAAGKGTLQRAGFRLTIAGQ